LILIKAWIGFEPKDVFMKEAITLRSTALGFLSWLVPFAVSFLFVDRTGQFLIPQPLFKSLTVVVFGGLGTALLVAAFRRIVPSTQTGLAIGLYWLGINLVLDLLILIPLIGVPIIAYFYDIGLRYLLIPIISTAIGAVAQNTIGKTA
jgi:hypothetical protein